MDTRERYTRQIMIDDWGESAQERLKASRVGIVGAGGLGSPVATYLAAAGVGTIVICDDQKVEMSNLNRQVMYKTRDIGRPKADLAAEFLTALNPGVTVIPRHEKFSDENGDSLWSDCRILIDCLDNWESRFLLNRHCVKNGIPFVHGGVMAHWGQFGLLHPPQSACLGCFIDPHIAVDTLERGPTSAIGAVAGAVGSLMALTAIRHIGAMDPPAAGIMRFLDTRSMAIENVILKRRVDCPVCGEKL